MKPVFQSLLVLSSILALTSTALGQSVAELDDLILSIHDNRPPKWLGDPKHWRRSPQDLAREFEIIRDLRTAKTSSLTALQAGNQHISPKTRAFYAHLRETKKIVTAPLAPFCNEDFLAHAISDRQTALAFFAIDTQRPLNNHLDRRAHFRNLQPQIALGACSAFAIIAGMEGSARKPLDLSELFLYSLHGRYENPNDFLLADSGMPPLTALMLAKHQGVVGEQDFPWFDHVLPPELAPQQAPRWRIESFALVRLEDATQDADFLRRLLAHGYFPIVSIRGCERQHQFDWQVLTATADNTGHAFTLIGYGNEPEAYFLVRDSAGSYPIHYKIAEKNLLTFMRTLAVIRRVELLVEPLQSREVNASSSNPRRNQ